MFFNALFAFAAVALEDGAEDCGYSKAFGGYTDPGEPTCGLDNNLINSYSCPGPRRGCDATDCRTACAEDLTCNYYYYGKLASQPSNWCYLWTKCEGEEELEVGGQRRTYVKQCGEGAGTKDGVRSSLLAKHQTCSETPLWEETNMGVKDCRNKCIAQFFNAGVDQCKYFNFWNEDGDSHCQGFNECTLVDTDEGKGYELYELSLEDPDFDCSTGVHKEDCEAMPCKYYRGTCWPLPNPDDFDCAIDDYGGGPCRKPCCNGRPQCTFHKGKCFESPDGPMTCDDYDKKGKCNEDPNCFWFKGCNTVEA